MEQLTSECWSIIIEVTKAVFISLAAVTAAVFATWRYRTADKQLQQDRFQSASKQLSEERMGNGKDCAIIRVSSIIMLGILAREDPKEYHVAVMRIFEIFLTWTTVFGSSEEGIGVVDVESNDIAEARRFVENRTKKQMRAEGKADYEFSLRGESPFYIGSEGKLYLKNKWVSRVRRELDKRGIYSPFMAERHPL